MSPSIWQLLIVLAIVLLLFGGKRLANLGGDLGSAIKGFKKSMQDEENKEEEAEDESQPGRLQDSDSKDANFDQERHRKDSEKQS